TGRRSALMVSCLIFRVPLTASRNSRLSSIVGEGVFFIRGSFVRYASCPLYSGCSGRILLDLEVDLDKIFIDEVVAEMHTIQDMLRWAMSRFNDAGIFYGHGTDNAWDEAVQLVL